MAALRIAVMGAGLIGRRHLGVLLADPAYAVAGIADPSPAAEAFARAHGVAHFADAERMLDQAKPDGVVIATPNQHHVTAGLACVARRLPMLIEKPIADRVADAVDLVARAGHAAVPILVGHHRRHNPIMRKAAEVIGDGAIGQVVAAVGLWLSRKPDDYYNVTWRREPGGGPVLINAIHDIDCLRMLCGDIESVQASTSSVARGLPVEDTAAAVLRFANGALGTLIVSDAVSSPWTWEWTSEENPFYPHEPRDCFLVTGTRGSLAVPSLEHGWHEPGQGWGQPLTRRRIPVMPADPYVEQLRNFARVIRGEDKPVVSGQEGTRTLAATLGITESARTGLPIRIDDMLKRP
ncbi:MAG: Gfo/Idh/MocA family oxidoreductase [Alphaproteobacteria bacterium]|nr:Gfo/Idh/MocA family oxidoreductase [Alphaproteobacteria bacterium]